MDKLVLDQVCKNYGDVEAVKSLSVAVKDGEFLTIVGPSGCGKSSTLRMIAGLETVTSGKITLDGRVINDVKAKDRNIALAFESYALYPHLTAFENLAFPLEVRGFNRADIVEKVNSTLELLNLEEVKDKKPGELSGGQQQRVSLGRALIREASVYLLDEPLSHLDAQERLDLRGELLRIQKLNALTFILVTHDQLEAVAMSDRILVMNDGRMQQVGTPDELYDQPANLFVADFIGEPPMNFLSGRLVAIDGALKVECEKSDFAVPVSLGGDLTEYVNKEVTLGIRPTYINLCETSHPAALRGQVFSFEDLGEVGYLTLDCGGERILIEVSGQKGFKTGEQVSFLFDQKHLCLFSPETGNRIK
ncbi:MAG: ABC transporter ATP-binding protein [Chloroflexota bacterium]